MADMTPNKTKAAEQDPTVRSSNFQEVCLGYTEEEALHEAARCLDCKNPQCVTGCPVAVPIPQFLEKVRALDFAGAYQLISAANALPAISGRVCPQENQCEGKCVRGKKGDPVGIGRLERFVADWARAHDVKNLDKAPSNGKKVAVVGSGPSGLTCAGELARRGYEVTVFEALHLAGGVLSYGIPEFRLPKAIVRQEVASLEQLGVDVETDMVIGKVLSVDELKERGFDAVYIATGAGLPMFMNIPGETLVGVYSANEFLTRINLMGAYRPDSNTPVLSSQKTIVVGGGNVAMDSARCARRMGAEVHVLYRRGRDELPARREEVEHAMEEGIKFDFLAAPTVIHGDDKFRVKSVTCVRMELGEPDASGRRSPREIPGSEYELEADTVIMALGTLPNPLIRSTTPGLDFSRKGCIVTDESCATSKPLVWAGGDASSGAATVILAMGAGKRAAAAIDEKLK